MTGLLIAFLLCLCAITSSSQTIDTKLCDGFEFLPGTNLQANPINGLTGTVFRNVPGWTLSYDSRYRDGNRVDDSTECEGATGSDDLFEYQYYYDATEKEFSFDIVSKGHSKKVTAAVFNRYKSAFTKAWKGKRYFPPKKSTSNGVYLWDVRCDSRRYWALLVEPHAVYVGDDNFPRWQTRLVVQHVPVDFEE